MERKLTELELTRRNKLNKIIEMGMDGYAKNVAFSDNSKSLNDKYDKYSKEELQELNEVASVVFRIFTIRGPFLVGKDANGPAQAFIGKDFPKEVRDVLALLDIGDIVRVEGKVMKTKTGVITIRGENLKLVTKALKPLPEKFHGLKDVEERYRHRYVDLMINDDVKKVFWTRTKIIRNIRRFMDDLGYMEADTPVLSPILGGASAEPFRTHHNALDMPFYLRIATELPLKKLLVGGIEKVYELGRIFRNEGVDTTHNPEFSSIEFYEAYSNLEGMMKRTEEIFLSVAKMLNKTELEFHDKKISIKPPFARVNMVDKVSEITKKDMREISLDDISVLAKENGIKVEKFHKVGHLIAELFEVLYEDKLIQPTFVWGHPIEISPLAAKAPKDERFTERAELFINGKEYANMFTELNDPIDQLNRFNDQIEEGKKGNSEANEIDMDFVEALEYGMPPAGGCGIGIDRMVMLFTGQKAIREVLLFPHLKNKPE